MPQTNCCRIGAIAVLVCASFCGPAFANVIIQPSSATTTITTFSSLNNAINQSALSAAYVSGVTPFDAYVASATHGAGSANRWIAANVEFPGVVTFDLGALFAVNGIAMWGSTSGTGSMVNAFEVFADTNTNFGDGGLTSLGSFNGANVGGVGQPFLFPTSSTQFVHVRIDSYHGGADLSVGEFAFRTAVPEPTTVSLLTLGGLALLTRRRRDS